MSVETEKPADTNEESAERTPRKSGSSGPSETKEAPRRDKPRR